MKYILFYKPYAVLSQFSPEKGKQTFKDFLTLSKDMYPVGRLDYDSEGLILLTNDNGIKSNLTDPKFEHPKTYLVQVERIPSEASLQKLRDGIIVEKEKTKPAEIELLLEEPKLPPRSTPIRFRKNVPTAWLKIILREGRNRQVRKMTAAVGHPTLRLIRIKIGNVEIQNLQPGNGKKSLFNKSFNKLYDYSCPTITINLVKHFHFLYFNSLTFFNILAETFCRRFRLYIHPPKKNQSSIILRGGVMKTMCIMFVVLLGITFCISAQQEKSVARATDWTKAELNYKAALKSANNGVKVSAANYVRKYNLTGAIEELKSLLSKENAEHVKMSGALALYTIGGNDGKTAIEHALVMEENEIVAEFYKSILNNQVVAQK